MTARRAWGWGLPLNRSRAGVDAASRLPARYPPRPRRQSGEMRWTNQT